MNLNQLEYFVSVAETLNFTRAAARCFISQTAMTQQIRSLEEKVGVPLLIRDKHHVELTPAGRIYLKEAKEILEKSDAAMRLARSASEGMQGSLTIGYMRGYGQSEFPALLRAYRRKYPGIQIHLVRENMSVLMNRLEMGEIDLAMIVSPFTREYPDLHHTYLRNFQVMAVLPAGHPLADRPYLTYPSLKKEEFIMMEPADRPRDQMEESMLIYERGGYMPNVVALEGEAETLMLMISAGMGISLIPEYITRLYQNSAELRILPMVKADGSAETLPFEAAWSENNANPVVESFLEFVGNYENHQI